MSSAAASSKIQMISGIGGSSKFEQLQRRFYCGVDHPASAKNSLAMDQHG
jgi:hypothetical protein